MRRAVILFGAASFIVAFLGGTSLALAVEVPPADPGRLQSSTQQLDPCALLMIGEIEAAVGPAYPGQGQSQSIAPVTVAACYWGRPDSGGTTALSLVLNTYADPESVAQKIAGRRATAFLGFEPVDAIGDAAFWEATTGTLEVYQGTYEVILQGTPLSRVGETPSLSRAAALDLATQAISRLP